jgi:hypothetical protein
MLQRSKLGRRLACLNVRRASAPRTAASRSKVKQISTIFRLDLSAAPADDRVEGRATILERSTLDERHKIMIRRRDLLLAVTASGAAAALSAPSVPATPADRSRDKRKPQYRANSAEVQTFYRVNRYPAK